jgi:Dolichyl-phosphate-mannose-protein mannosyltransferase
LSAGAEAPARAPDAASRLLWLAPLLVAAGLAFWSIGFGLPYLFRPDEDIMVGRSVHMALDHSIDPLFFNYPPLGFYLFALAEAALGLFPGQHLGPASQVDPSAEYLVARALSALAVVSAVGMVYLAGRQAYGRAAGLIAASALALSPLAIRQAHFATTDGLAMAMVAAALWAALRARSRGGYVVAGAVCSLAAATKYTAGAALVFVLAMALLGRDRPARAIAAIGGAAVSFVLVMASAGHPREYLQGLAFLGGRAGAAYGGLPIGWIYHPAISLPFGLGIGTYAMALTGIVLALSRRRRVDLALVAFLLVYGSVIGFSHEVFFRYVLPMLPALCLLAGGLLRLARPGVQRSMVALAALLLMVPGAAASIDGDRLLGATDTRQLAADWLMANAPAGSELRISSYWSQPFYDQSEVQRKRLNPLYVSGNWTADSFEQGRFTARFRTNRVGSPCFVISASGPPWQGPLPATPKRPVAVFRPHSGTALIAGGVYDRIDSFYLPIWGFGNLDRPGPSIAIVEGC